MKTSSPTNRKRTSRAASARRSHSIEVSSARAGMLVLQLLHLRLISSSASSPTVMAESDSSEEASVTSFDDLKSSTSSLNAVAGNVQLPFPRPPEPRCQTDFRFDD